MKKLKKIWRRSFGRAKFEADKSDRVRALPVLPNESINLEQECIFVAVPKTGTTSVRDQLRQTGEFLIPNAHLNIMQLRELLYVHLLRSTLGANRSFPTESVLSDLEIREQASAMYGSFFKFSAVRNPWARAVSLYFRREGVLLKDEMSFDDFCERHLYASDTCWHPTLHRNQLDWLCDEFGVCQMDYVYKVEDFPEAIREIYAMTNGRIQLELHRANSNPDSKSGNYREMFSNRSRKLIEKRFERDIDYFKYTF